MIRVLVTCVGSGVGQSVIDSLNLSRNYYIVGCDSNANVYGHSFCDKFYSVISIYDKNYIDDIISKALKENVDIIIPGHDYELYLFSSNIEKFRKAGLEILVSEPTLIKISRNKKDWYDYFNSKSCSIVPTFSLSEYMQKADDAIFPAIAKPVGGSASQGIFIINSANELSTINKDNELIIQPYLFPEKTDENYTQIANMVAKGNFVQMSEISIQLVFDKDAKYRGIFISKNILKNGIPINFEPLNPKEFKYLDEILKFVPILEKKGVKGPVNIQGRITEKGIYFFEMNMRFTGITGNRALFGFNEVSFLVNNFLNKPCSLEKYTYNKIGVRQVACSTISKSNKSNIITILGGGSSIGKYFINKIYNDSCKIKLITRKSSLYKYNNIFKSFKNINIIDTDNPFVENYLAESDTLINFVSSLANTTEEQMYDAVLFIQNLLPRIIKAKIPKLVNISSQSVYNQKSDSVKCETDTVYPNNPYAFQKIMLEKLFNSVNHYNPQSKVVSLRLTRVLNPLDKQQCGFFGKIISECKQGNTVNISTPLNKTNLIHIDDVVSAINFVLKNMNTFENIELFNIGAENITMQNFAEKTEKIISVNNYVFTYGKQDKTEVASIVDCSKIEKLGWGFSKSTDDIIKELL